MPAFRRILFTAALAGLLTGLAVTAVHSLRVLPLILRAETYERAPEGKRPEAAGLLDDPDRLALTALANVLTAMGLGLLLAAAFHLRGETGPGWREGLLWGLGGFASFSLAPALGLPPEPPGTLAAPLPLRQAWWALAALSTAGGLALLVFVRGAAWKALGAALLVLPHLIGAPHPPQPGGSAPESLQRAFAAASLAASAVLWLLLGALSGYFYRRLARA